MNPRGEVKSDPRRSLPSVDRLVRALDASDDPIPPWALREAAREVLDAERERLGREVGPAPDGVVESDLVARARARAHSANATSIAARSPENGW